MFTNLKQLDAFGNSAFGATQAQLYQGTLFGLGEDEIVKALATDGVVGSDGSAMIGESLDPVVKKITLDPENYTPILRRFYTYDAKAIVEEFNRVNSLGRSGGSFRAQGQIGVQDAASYSRYTENVRFVGQTGAVTVELQNAARAKFGDIKAIESTFRLQKLLLDIDRDLLWGNSTVNSLSWRGLFQQSSTESQYNSNKATTSVAGSRTTYTGGGTLSASDIRNQSSKPISVNARYTACYLSPQDIEVIGSAQDGNLRWYLEDQKSAIALGMRVEQIKTAFGPIDLVWDIWLNYENGRLNPNPEDPSVSTNFHTDAPSILAVAPSGAAAAGGYLPVDTYYYAVAQANEVGEGPIKFLAAGYTTDNTNGTVTLTVTHNADTSDVRSYRVYRSTTNNTDYTKMRFVKEVAIDTAAATQAISDDGSHIPGSRRAFLISEKSAAIGALQVPTIRDLPMVDNTHRFTIDAQLMVQLYANQHMYVFKNLGGSVEDPA